MAKIVAGSNTEKLSEKVAALTGIKIARKTVKKFPDGETYVRLEDADFKGDCVFLIHSLYPDQNERLIELFMTINAVKENGGKPVVVIPYQVYGRQDRIFEKGEAFSLKIIAEMLKDMGTEKLITIDSHFYRNAGDFDFFGLPAKNVSAVKKLREHFGEGFTIAGPDEGSKDFLNPLDDVVFLKKSKTFKEKKDGKVHYEIEIEAPEIEGDSVLLIDDIISTGGTMITAAKALKEQGKKVSVACTHGLFLGNSLNELKKYADEIISTDTIKSACSKVSVAGLIAEEIKSL